MTVCVICGSEPCINPSFCAACRGADRRKARGERPRFIEASLWHSPSDRIPENWQEMSLEALIAHFGRARQRYGAPQPTVEALMHSLRERGTAALEALLTHRAPPSGSGVEAMQRLRVQYPADTKRRLFELNDQQVIEVGNRLQRLKPEIARPWTAAEVEVLFEARVKNA